ncbi:ankyrin repeat and sterile alpha motif domain-containing protein 1B isoform X4 [Bactrocera neohumeralis]|uniref:ankyrin repeat and sterile alpha motif domain-containing protein 1B isoform X5 n=1 Tax=Bactrocera tryoni TaxID=59916 RepID=UPI001A95D1F6|nr:ankyrin repeat and sterile alpha motif domain-containing protein 1B isoform X5 [Bactrocera tryoni]XP_050339729.1 ankyrin repeat and sterile alpha motif domain-containing protein 1B isoform X4 [Bactrocera neohumeralis]
MGKDQELLEAARIGNIAVVGKILEQISKRNSGPFSSFRRSPCINSQDVNGYTPLHHACLNGHGNIVRLLLVHNAAPDMPDIRGSTPLYLAAWAGHDEIVKQLLLHTPKAANPNAQTIDNETPLHCAAQHGHNTVLAILLAYGADPTVRNNSFQTALDLAAQFGRLQAVQTLIRTHPELLAPYRSSGSKTPTTSTIESTPYTISPSTHLFTHTCLHLASRNGHKKVVEALLAAGVDVNIMTNSGTALHEAALCGKKAVVNVLLQAGVNPNATDGSGHTALDLLKDYPPHVTYEIVCAIKDFYKDASNGTHFKPINELSDGDDHERSDSSISPVPNIAFERGQNDAKVSAIAHKEFLMPKTPQDQSPPPQPCKVSPVKDANNNCHNINEKKHSPTPDFPPPTVFQAEHTILEFMRPNSTHSKRKSLGLKQQPHPDLESFIMDAINQFELPDSPVSSRVSDCVEEFVGDAPFAGLFKGSTLNLAMDGKEDGFSVHRASSGLRSPSLVRSIKPLPPKRNIAQSQKAVDAENFNAAQVWAEIDTILESIGNEVNKQSEQISELNKTSTLNKESLQIRRPAALCLGSNDDCANNWCHSPNTLIFGQILYTVYYLGSTVIRELHGTTSTRKSILKFKRNATPLPVVKERESNLVKDCNNLTKMLKESNQDTRLKVGLAVSCGGVKFLNTDNSSTICTHDIENINCVCQDAEDLRYFAYITKEEDMHYCHVFMVDNLELSHEIILTLGEAFEVAYQLALSKEDVAPISNNSRSMENIAEI